FMLHRLRLAMKADGGEMLSGEVEADETFIGGKQKATKRSASGHHVIEHGPATGKTTVFGMVQRGPNKRVRAIVVPDHKRASLLPHIRANVFSSSTAST